MLKELRRTALQELRRAFWSGAIDESDLGIALAAIAATNDPSLLAEWRLLIEQCQKKAPHKQGEGGFIANPLGENGVS